MSPKLFSNHIVIIGWDEFARAVTEQLINANKRIFVITEDERHIEAINENYDQEQLRVMCCDFTNFTKIKKSNIENCMVCLINLPTDTDKLVYVVNLRKTFGNVEIVVSINNAYLRESFHNAGVRYPLSKDEIAAKMVSSYLFEREVAEYCDNLLESARCDEDVDIQQLKVIETNPFLNKTCGTAFKKIKQDYNGILIGISKVSQRNNGKRKLIKNPADHVKIELNDYLIVIISGKYEGMISDAFGVEEGYLD